MADQQHTEGSSSSDLPGGNPESMVELNIKTLDSRIYSFHVDKNMVVSAFKEKVASQVNVPVGQQRLIFRGKVLKDNDLLSVYNVENGDTLHLVERQPQPPTGSGGGEAMANNGNRGQEANAGGQRNRVGQIAHSIVLGTLNVGDPGEAVVPDISRVIGAVLNSIGIGNMPGGMPPGMQFQPPQGSEEGLRVNSGNQSQAGNPSAPSQANQSSSNPMQFSQGAAVVIPSLNMPIPDSLRTVTEFMNHMESAFSQNGYQPNQASDPTNNPSPVELPSNARGLSTAETLSVVLRHAERVLSGHAASALSSLAHRLDEEGSSSDPTQRGQIQTQSAQVGIAMQHLGALLLELGRTILTLRMGQSPGESIVNSGPAVYISSSGPNPIMVQPFPLQTSSLFGGSSGAPPNPAGPVGIGGIPRNVNIHIHTGASLAPAVATLGGRPERPQGERGNGTASRDSGQLQRNLVPASTPARANSVSENVQPGPDPSGSPDELVSEINSYFQNLVGDNNASSGRSDGPSSTGVSQSSQPLPGAENQTETGSKSSNNAPSTSLIESSNDSGSASGSAIDADGAKKSDENNDGSSRVPLGLGLGGLQPKRRTRQSGPASKSSDGSSASTQSERSRAVGQRILSSLSSRTVPSAQLEPPQQQTLPPTSGQNADDIASAIPDFLQSPAAAGILSGFSQETGVGSPDMLRNMLQTVTQNPTMRNTLNQVAQQIDRHDLGTMFSGMSGGQGGGIDLSRMIQQMMPIVSQALGGMSMSSPPPVNPPMEPQTRSTREMRPAADGSQFDLRPVVQSLESQSPPGEIFRSLVERVERLYDNGTAVEGIVDEICNEGHLVEEFMEMLRHDISSRLRDDPGS